MTTARRILRPSTLVATSIFLPVLICLFVLVSSAAAQTAAAAPPPAKVKLDVSNAHLVLKQNVPSAFNFCTGQSIPLPKGRLNASKGLKLDTAQGKCGDLSGSAANSMVSGGNPPYHFQLDTMGGFPPIGMHLGLNGVLYGTPSAKPPLGGWPEFGVCAVDMSGNSDCPKVQVTTEPAPRNNANKKLLWGSLAIGAVAIVGVAAVAGSSSSSSGAVTGTCNGTSPVNACGACSCTDGGTCNQASSQCGGDYCTWAGPGSTVGQAPFCAGPNKPQ